MATPFLRLNQEARLQLYVHLSSLTGTRLAQLKQRGLRIELTNEDLGIVQGWASIDDIGAIAALPFVREVEPPDYAIVNQGSRVSEGAAILRADVVRESGLDGSGVRIGIISDGANDLSDAQSSGDLPSDVTTFGSCLARSEQASLCDAGSTCNEGTAIAEIIHDIAPAAELAIASVATTLEFITRVDELVNDFGADVVVDDLSFYRQPYFTDGSVAQAVAAVSNQVVFISAAGNAADRHYESGSHLVDFFSEALQASFPVHDFGTAAGGAFDVSLNVTIGPQDYLLAILQWDEPFGSSANDFDLVLGNVSESNLLTCNASVDGVCLSAEIQNGDDDPIESFCYYNNSRGSIAGKIAIANSRTSAAHLELFVLGSGKSITEHVVPEGSVIGHAALADVLAVGAIHESDPGADDIAPDSSQGPSRIHVPSTRVRSKPDLVAIDGVSVTGAGGFPSQFFGTSAAAAHVAGIAGLLRQGAPGATPAEIRGALTSGAIDLGQAGADNIYGSGLVDAVASRGVFRADADGDGIEDDLDLFPDDAAESSDNDDDGIGDNADDDDDNDRLPDDFERAYGGDPLVASNVTEDTDGDGLNNLEEFERGYDAGDPLSPLRSPRTDVLLVSSVLPGSRSVRVGDTATAFGTVINAGITAGSECRIVPITTVDADFFYQTTDPATNGLTHSRNQSIEIAGGNGIQSFIFGFTPRSAFASTVIELGFRCSNANDATPVIGVNTLRMSASDSTIADIVALSATNPTCTFPGTVFIDSEIGAGAFSVGTVNLGAAGTITASVDTGSAGFDSNLFVCATEASGLCIDPPSPTATLAVGALATPTFAVFVNSAADIPFDPAVNRAFVRFTDDSGEIRGATSVAVTSFCR